MLQNAYFLAKIGADTAENEQHLAEILPIGLGEGLGEGPRPAPRDLAHAAVRRVALPLNRNPHMR